MEEYEYDPYGIQLTTASGIGAINPFRYRGYYYDSETGYYYLQSRYYDPTICRFINADDISFLGASGTLLGLNLYIYCENDPINFHDPTGHSTIALTLPYVLIASMSSALGGIMSSIGSAIAGIKTAIATSWCIPICITAVAVAIVGITHAINRVNALMGSAKKVISAVKSKVKLGGLNPKKLGNYTVYVITRKGTADVVYVGITKNYNSRKNNHMGPGKRFPTSMYTMIPIATNLSKKQARAMEQTIISAYSLDTLKNMINSISPRRWNSFIVEFAQMNTLIQSWLDPQ